MKKKVKASKESYKPSKALEKVLRKADRDIKAGRNLSPVFTNMEEMDAYLNKLCVHITPKVILASCPKL